ncbi:MAG: 50S ribosomal protein L24 [bacterium]|nr:50S ribosomal protein L24 [bacterium]
MNIKKGDNVKVLSGKNRGKTGKVIAVNPARERVTVEGLNLYKKHTRPRKQGEKGQVISISRPMHVSNTMLVCPSCKEAARVGHRMEGERKVRYCKSCNATI